MKNTLARAAIAGLLALATLLAVDPALAAPGDLDPTFGTNGVAIVRVGPSTDQLQAIAIRPDGKVIAIGVAGPSFTTALARYNADGSLDQGFGNGGIAFLKDIRNMAAALVQPDGRIVVMHCPISIACQLARFEANAQPDTSFTSMDVAPPGLTTAYGSIALLPDGRIVGVINAGQGSRVFRASASGVVDPSFSYTDLQARLRFIGVQGDGKIVLGGDNFTAPGESPTRLEARRLLPDGTVDAAFSPGVIQAPDPFAGGLALLPDGKVAIVGQSEGTLAIARLDSSGQPDASFGNGGLLKPVVAGEPPGYGSGVVVRPDGKIALYTAYGGNTPSDVIQINANGSVDTSFGTSGRLRLMPTAPQTAAYGYLALAADGSLLVGDARSRDFSLARIKADGTLDGSFGTGGIVNSDLGLGSSAYLTAVRSRNGKVIALAQLYVPFGEPNNQVGLARYLADGSLDPTFGANGQATGSLADEWGEAFVTVMDTQPDEKIVVAGRGKLAGVAGIGVGRFNSNGTPDTTFGVSGRRVVPGTPDGGAWFLQILEDGKILAAGIETTYDSVTNTFVSGNVVIARLLPDGSHDPQFGQDGIVKVDPSSYAIRGLPGGGLLVGRSSGSMQRITRLLPNGAIDTAFGTGGTASFSRAGVDLSVNDILTHPDGRIVVAGFASTSGSPPNGPTDYAAAVFTRIGPNGTVGTASGDGVLASTLGSGRGSISRPRLDGSGRIVALGSVASAPGPVVARFTPAGALDTSFGHGGTASLPGDPGIQVRDMEVLGDGRLLVAFQDSFSAGEAMKILRLEGGGVSSPLPAPGDVDNDGSPDAVDRDPLVRDNDVFADAQLFAMQQYRDFLGREGDVAGIAYWSAQLTSGALNRRQMVETYFDSPEFQGAGAPVVRLYFSYFLRIPDYDGLQFWISQARGASSLETISNAFAASREFIDTYGALDNERFVDRVYQNVLGRAPDVGGRAFWTNHLAAGMTRGRMMVSFSESAEYRALIANEVYVTMMYVGMLRRAPDAGGFAHWVGYLDAGYTGQALINAFLGAPEYRKRFVN